MTPPARQRASVQALPLQALPLQAPAPQHADITDLPSSPACPARPAACPASKSTKQASARAARAEARAHRTLHSFGRLRYEATRPRSPPCERAIYFREKRRRWHLKHTGAIGPTPALPTRYLEWDAWSFLTPPPLSPDSRETSDTMEQPVEVEDAGRGVRFFKRVSHGSSCARMDGAINNGIYYWQLHLGDRMYGTSIQVGIGTAEVRHASHAFKNIIGEDENGWGMSHKGVVWHNGLWAPYTEPFTQNEDTVIGVMFDGVAGTLGFFKDNRWMGVAFKGLDKVNKPLYPMVAATARNTKFTLLSARCDVGTLLDRCRSAVLRALHNPDDVESLPLPDPIRAFILEGVVTPTVLPITNPAQRLLM